MIACKRAAESVQNAAGWRLQLLLPVERIGRGAMQPLLWPHQVRADQGRLLYHLH